MSDETEAGTRWAALVLALVVAEGWLVARAWDASRPARERWRGGEADASWLKIEFVRARWAAVVSRGPARAPYHARLDDCDGSHTCPCSRTEEESKPAQATWHTPTAARSRARHRRQAEAPFGDRDHGTPVLRDQSVGGLARRRPDRLDHVSDLGELTSLAWVRRMIAIATPRGDGSSPAVRVARSASCRSVAASLPHCRM